MITSLENVESCDLCGSPNSSPIYRLSDILYQVPGEFTLQSCSKCDLMYLSPRPTPEAIGAYYPDEYICYRPPIEQEKWGIMRWIRRRKLVKRRQLIERYGNKSMGAVLDVGCATGLFLHEMEQSGWHVTGIEPISSAAEYARQQFDLEVFEGRLSKAPYQESSFDVITFWDVLEHTYHPSQELADAASLLRPNGLLVLSIPNWDSVERHLFKHHWHGLDSPRHLYVFTHETLTTYLNNAGFLVLDWVCFMPSYFSFIISVKRWLQTKNPTLSRIVWRILSISGMRMLFEPFFALINYRGKGSVVTVFAVKKPE